MTSELGRLRWPAAALGLLVITTGCGSGTSTSPAPSTPSVTRPVPTSSAPSTVSASGVATAPLAGTAQAPVPVESNPPGDIPDNLAFVAYRNLAGGYAFTYPEGWARAESGTAVTFTDKLDGITADVAGAPETPTTDRVRQQVVPRLQQSEPAFELRTLEPVSLPAGQGVRLVYRRNSAPDPVTGRQVRDEVESYLIAHGGKQVRLDLFGPVGADNVDAYRTITRSLALS